jgi:gas vesicle protein
MNKIIIAFTSGIVLGLLFAPASGKDTRKKIGNVGNDCKEGWNKFTDKIAGKIDSIKDRVDDMAYSAVEKIESTQFDTSGRTI